ncbi:hypothetical protein [Rhizobium vallis]|nr:hypothetical protein [Rhizobium vallis]
MSRRQLISAAERVGSSQNTPLLNMACDEPPEPQGITDFETRLHD